MRPKHIVMRTCVVSHEKCEKKDLLRIVRTTEKEIKIDQTGKMNGRGAYIKKDLNIIEQAKKTKALDRALETKIPEEIYEEIEKII